MRPVYESKEDINKESEVAMKAAASWQTEWLKGKGYDIRHPPQATRPRDIPASQRWKYTDDGDLEITLEDGTKRIEVKYWPHIKFRSLTDIPYAEVIVDEAYKIEQQHTYPLLAYIIVDQSKQYGLMILKKSSEHWKQRRKFDRAEGEERDFYMCPKGLCKIYYIGATS